MIYLDNAATTFPKPDSVYAAMDEINRKKAVNAGRGSYKVAREASALIVDVKKELRRLVRAEASAAVILTPSITIALNQVINGIEWRNGATVYVSPYEHNAVARTLHRVANYEKLNVRLLPLTEETMEIDLEKMKYEFSKERPFCVICTHVSNVTGYILPVKEIFEEAKKYDAITVLDSAQSLGLIDVNVSQIPADIIGFAGHKCLYGPFGVGGFINVSNIKLKTYITGGTGSDSLNLEMPEGPEAMYEAASSNIVAIAGLYAALKELNVGEIQEKEKKITRYCIDKLANIKGIKIYLPGVKENHVGIISFTIRGFSSEDIGTILDEDYDIAVRTGYHCAPYIHDYLKDKNSLGTVRIGLGQYTTQDEIDKLALALKEIVE